MTGVGVGHGGSHLDVKLAKSKHEVMMDCIASS